MCFPRRINLTFFQKVNQSTDYIVLSSLFWQFDHLILISVTWLSSISFSLGFVVDDKFAAFAGFILIDVDS